MTHRQIAGLALALALINVASVAVADEPASSIARGVALYDDLEYEAAAKALRAALGNARLSEASKVTGYQTLGLALVALGRENEARDAFRKLLEIDRRFALPDTVNPKARDLLEEVRGDLASDIELSATARPVPLRADGPVTITITVTDPSAVTKSVIAHYRIGDSRAWSSIQATRTGDGKWTATISGAFVTGPSVSYYVEALAVDGRPLARVASADEPRQLAVEKKIVKSRSLLASPWLWAGVGIVAAGGVAAYFLLQEEPTATGSVLIEPTSPPMLRF